MNTTAGMATSHLGSYPISNARERTLCTRAWKL